MKDFQGLKLSQKNIQLFKNPEFLQFVLNCGSFMPFRIRILSPNPDPETQFNHDQSHWYELLTFAFLFLFLFLFS